jgi:hypothetical protein
MSELKFCKDCRHFYDDATEHVYPLCSHPNARGEPDMVTGGRNRPTCDFARRTEGMCGREARWYHEIHTEGKP